MTLRRIMNIFARNNVSFSDFDPEDYSDNDGVVDEFPIGLFVMVTSWSIIAFVILIGNGFICLIFFQTKTLREGTPNKMLVSQACTDLVTGFLFIPVQCYDKFKQAPLLEALVRNYCLPLSMFSLSSLAIDRLVAVLHPLYYKRVFAGCFVRKEILLVWILPVPLAFLSLPIYRVTEEFETQYNNVYYIVSYTIFTLWLLSMMAINIIVFMTAKRNIRNRLKQIHRNTAERLQLRAKLVLHKKELRLASLFALLTLTFIVTYIPVIVATFYAQLGTSEDASEVLIFSATCVYTLSSVINPTLCFLMKSDFRRGLIKLCKKKNAVAATLSSSKVTPSL